MFLAIGVHFINSNFSISEIILISKNKLRFSERLISTVNEGQMPVIRKQQYRRITTETKTKEMGEKKAPRPRPRVLATIELLYLELQSMVLCATEVINEGAVVVKSLDKTSVKNELSRDSNHCYILKVWCATNIISG